VQKKKRRLFLRGDMPTMNSNTKQSLKKLGRETPPKDDFVERVASESGWGWRFT
jgi:hypothetical protein